MKLNFNREVTTTQGTCKIIPAGILANLNLTCGHYLLLAVYLNGGIHYLHFH